MSHDVIEAPDPDVNDRDDARDLKDHREPPTDEP